MCVKAQLRNRRPVIIALATNDGLSANLFNIAMTLEKKNIYFTPFGQDNAYDKPTSLICDFNLIQDTLELAVQGKQLQPLLL
jgi:dipicolinate synthase subunit B